MVTIKVFVLVLYLQVLQPQLSQELVDSFLPQELPLVPSLVQLFHIALLGLLPQPHQLANNA
jgi:hypothetical protein